MHLDAANNSSRPGTSGTSGTTDTGGAGSSGTPVEGDNNEGGQNGEDGGDWINTIDDYQRPGLMKPLFPSWVGIGDHPAEEAAAIKECLSIHDYEERDSAVMKRVFRY